MAGAMAEIRKAYSGNGIRLEGGHDAVTKKKRVVVGAMKTLLRDQRVDFKGVEGKPELSTSRAKKKRYGINTSLGAPNLYDTKTTILRYGREGLTLQKIRQRLRTEIKS